MNPRIKYFSEVSSKPMSESARKELRKENKRAMGYVGTLILIILMSAILLDDPNFIADLRELLK